MHLWHVLSNVWYHCFVNALVVSFQLIKSLTDYLNHTLKDYYLEWTFKVIILLIIPKCVLKMRS